MRDTAAWASYDPRGRWRDATGGGKMSFGNDLRLGFAESGSGFMKEFRDYDDHGADRNAAVQVALVTVDIIDSVRSTAGAMSSGESISGSEIAAAVSADLGRAATKAARTVAASAIAKQAVAQGMSQTAGRLLGGGIAQTAFKLGGFIVRQEKCGRNDLTKIAVTTTASLALSAIVTPFAATVVMSIAAPQIEKLVDNLLDS
jgi:hypothetical protein